MKWVSQARKGGGEFRGACLQGGVDGAAVICDERGGGVDRGFGSAPFQVEGCVPSCFIRCAKYTSSNDRYIQVVSNTSFDTPVTMFLLFL